MNALTAGVTTMFNGMLAVGSWALSPVGVALCILTVSATWLGLIEVELMDRSGAKPRVGRH